MPVRSGSTIRLLLTPAGAGGARALAGTPRTAVMSPASGQVSPLNRPAGLRLPKDPIRRGDWVVTPELHAPTDRPDVRLHLLASEANLLSKH